MSTVGDIGKEYNEALRRAAGGLSGGPGLPVGAPVFAGMPDIEATLARHGDDGDGYCAAGCNQRGWQYPSGECPTGRAALEAKARLLEDRRRSQ